jgi:hypothetical protein
MTLLNNSMFDDGSFECYNFWVADCDGCYQVSHSDTLIQHMKSQIETAMKAGKSHINTRNSELVYDGCPVLEIQWG